MSQCRVITACNSYNGTSLTLVLFSTYRLSSLWLSAILHYCLLQRTGRAASVCNSSDLCLEGALFAYRQWHYISGQALLLLFSHSRIHNSMQHSYSSDASGFTAIQGIPACYGTWRCSTMFPKARHLSSWARSIHSTSIFFNEDSA